MTNNKEDPLYKNITIIILYLAIIIAIIYIYYQKQQYFSLAASTMLKEGIVI